MVEGHSQHGWRSGRNRSPHRLSSAMGSPLGGATVEQPIGGATVEQPTGGATVEQPTGAATIDSAQTTAVPVTVSPDVEDSTGGSSSLVVRRWARTTHLEPDVTIGPGLRMPPIEPILAIVPFRPPVPCPPIPHRVSPIVTEDPLCTPRPEGAPPAPVAKVAAPAVADRRHKEPPSTPRQSAPPTKAPQEVTLSTTGPPVEAKSAPRMKMPPPMHLVVDQAQAKVTC